MTRDISVFVKDNTIFRLFFCKLPQIRTSNFHKVAQQHTKGWWEVLCVFCWKFSSLSSSERTL